MLQAGTYMTEKKKLKKKITFVYGFNRYFFFLFDNKDQHENMSESP